eukprot:gene16482-18711_t
MLPTNTSTAKPATRTFLSFEEFAEKIAPLFAKELAKESAEESSTEKEFVRNLYQDYKTKKNEKLPVFLKEKIQFEDPAVDDFVAVLLSLESRNTIQALLPEVSRLYTKREREGKTQGSEDEIELLKSVLLRTPPKDCEDLITRMFPVARTISRRSFYLSPSFQREFVQGIFDLRAYFKRKLEYSHNVYCETKSYYSPYVAVCQSSGYGKTRLILEMSDSYELIYICVRKEISTGQPPRTAVIADFIQGETESSHFSSSSGFSDFRRMGGISTMRQWVALLLALFVAGLYDLDEYEEYEDLPDITEISFKSFRTSKTSPSLKSPGAISYGKKLALSPSLQRVFFRLVIILFEQYNRLLPTTTSEIELQLAVEKIATNILKDIRGIPQGNVLTFLLAIDEASELFLDKGGKMGESFTTFRRALSIIPQKIFPFLCLLLDTNTKITTSSIPSVRWDSSHRIDPIPSLLLPPFITFPLEVKDILPAEIVQYPSNPVTIKISDRISSTAVFDPAQMVLLSRPLFPSALVDLFINKRTFEELHKACREIVNFAVGKLIMGELSLLVSRSGMRELSMKLFAVAACRYDLATTASSINEVLVRQHMATASTMSDLFIMANYPSEPILSEASIQIMMREDIFHRMLIEVGCYITDGTVLPDCNNEQLGELVACILLSCGYDMASNQWRLDQLRLQPPTSSFGLFKSWNLI